MPTIKLEAVPPDVQDAIIGLNPGESLIITKDGEPVVTLTRDHPRSWPAQAASARTADYWMAPDFDAPLDEFREYME